jgi:hypothetical protein
MELQFKQLMSRLHAATSKPRGYKKEGQNLRLLQTNGIGKIINFQRSMFNSDGECRFTINVGIYFQKDQEKPNLRFKEYECPIRTRVSGISERYTGDHWWLICDGTDMEKLYTELKTLLEEDVLPWLEQFATAQDVIRMGRSGALRGMIRGNIYLTL